MSKSRKIAVIGGGISGLTSALILARNGYRVTLVEKSPRLGQTMRGFSRQGVYFDTGLHYTGGLAEGGIVSRYLRYLGINGLDTAPFCRDGFDEIRFADTDLTVRLPVGCEAMGDALAARFPGQEKSIRAYIRAAKADFDSSSLLNFFFSFQDTPRELSPVSLSDYLKKLTDDAHLQAVLSVHSLLYGVSPHEIPFMQHAYVSASYFDSVHNFTGGGRALVEAMEQKLTELGVTVILGRAVKRLVCTDKKRLIALELDDAALLETDAAICTCHPAALADMGQDAFRPSYLERLRALEETSSAFMLFGIADKKPECLEGRNLFLCRDADISRAFTPGTKPDNGPFFVAACPQSGDPGGRAGIVVVGPGFFDDMRPWTDSTHGNRPESYKAFKALIMQRIENAVQELCPDLAAVNFVEGATPLTMRDFLHAPNGGLYGCKHTVNRFNPLPVTRISNLLLAGQSVIVPGLMGAMISAFLACGFLLGDSLHKDAACS
ncbi:MAG: NAD(P)/FAD-dependent oxidoreductase [Desulfovibrio sp.]|jgi:all-trans-retinol 13,14-reductase|nr:NAD(P)/FAD-dependent oxidoreductase [Desulfovibrio sp.]